MSIKPSERCLIVSIGSQSMALLEKERIERIFDISTSAQPPSSLQDSKGTPLGLHAAADKIGADQPAGMVFKGRRPTRHVSEHSDQEKANNLITSRIIRLQGLEPGINTGSGCDTYERYIYIHGTNHEARVGRPFSGGCIEMRNRDVLDLFELLAQGDHVWITPD